MRKEMPAAIFWIIGILSDFIFLSFRWQWNLIDSWVRSPQRVSMIHDSGGHGLYVGGIDDTTGCRHPQPQRQGAHSMIDFFMRRRRAT
ncbi:uncharacterized protein [Physcomitrium patens]|uniref:uncharacterized protein isoform X2 n=1 Tax=Physcomitrium patens TaxID=3218 RepID=UPI003CCCD166